MDTLGSGCKMVEKPTRWPEQESQLEPLPEPEPEPESE